MLIYQSALVLKIFDPNHTNFLQKQIRFRVGLHDKINDVNTCPQTQARTILGEHTTEIAFLRRDVKILDSTTFGD